MNGTVPLQLPTRPWAELRNPLAPIEVLSEDQVEAIRAQYSDKDISHMTTDDGKVEADCQFCGAKYVFDPEELGRGR